tara:strand:- start:265 stop:924 length:660 start_codon:yes stop_codon:yes gene_type:complete
MQRIKPMRHLKIGLIALLLASAPNIQAGEVSFRYGFIGKQTTGAGNLVAIEAGATLHSGDPLKLNFEHSKGTWFYICYRSTLDEYALLYSAKGRKSQQSEVAFGTLGWLVLDQNIGEENFILIASEKRLKKLEKFFANYKKSKGKSRKRFFKRIHALIEELQGGQPADKGAVLTQRLERPVIAGVAFRDSQNDGISAISLTHEASGNDIALIMFVMQHR